jgi:rRNA processing protein Gar1
LRSLGKVVNFSPKGSVVVRAASTPRIGQMVCDNKGRPIGKIIRITGPVGSPYVLISALAKDEISMFRLSGKQLFLDDSSRRPAPRERVARPRGPPPGNRQAGNRAQKSYKAKESRPQKNYSNKDSRSKNSKYSGSRKKGQR